MGMSRSDNMRAIRSKNMLPELAVRRAAHNLGYRFRLHRKDLPGKPDLVFPARAKVVLVHGCFWHCHDKCKVAHIPKSNLDYWIPKLERNRSRDAKNLEGLSLKGWDALVIWECETRDIEHVKNRLKNFLR